MIETIIMQWCPQCRCYYPHEYECIDCHNCCMCCSCDVREFFADMVVSFGDGNDDQVDTSGDHWRWKDYKRRMFNYTFVN